MNLRTEKLSRILNADEAFYITAPENVFYFSGFRGEGSLVITDSQAVIITDFRYIEDACRISDFSVFNIADGKENAFEKRIKTVKTEFNSLTVSQLESLKTKMPDKEFISDDGVIADERKIKDAKETELIKTAADIATDAFKKVLNMIVPGKITERRLAAEFEYLVKNAGADGVSFETIVASGVNSSMPHAVAGDKVIERGDLVTFDFGSKYKGYCSDMTRTVAVGKCGSEEKEIYNIVLAAQKKAVSAIKDGVSCAAADASARDIIAKAGYGNFFGHALGHGVGVMIHELPSLSPRSKDVLKENMAVTAEPGIYIEGRFGIRIEDLVIVEKEKCRILSEFSKELTII